MALTDKEKKKLLRNAKRTFLHEYASEMEMEAVDSLIMMDLPFIVTEDKTSEEILQSYRNSMESNVIGTLFTTVLDSEDDPRGALLSLLEGSALGDLLPELYRHWDEDIDAEELEELFNDSIEEARKFAELADSLDGDDEDFDSDLADLLSDVNDLPFN